MGPLFNWSDTWQLIANTVTTLITTLLVLLIQNSQNRDTAALHLKLDELLRATKDASNRLVAVEDDTEESLDRLKKRVRRDARKTPPNSPI